VGNLSLSATVVPLHPRRTRKFAVTRGGGERPIKTGRFHSPKLATQSPNSHGILRCLVAKAGGLGRPASSPFLWNDPWRRHYSLSARQMLHRLASQPLKHALRSSRPPHSWPASMGQYIQFGTKFRWDIIDCAAVELSCGRGGGKLSRSRRCEAILGMPGSYCPRIDCRIEPPTPNATAYSSCDHLTDSFIFLLIGMQHFGQVASLYQDRGSTGNAQRLESIVQCAYMYQVGIA
jgi:hypothetical protein